MIPSAITASTLSPQSPVESSSATDIDIQELAYHTVQHPFKPQAPNPEHLEQNTPQFRTVSKEILGCAMLQGFSIKCQSIGILIDSKTKY